MGTGGPGPGELRIDLITPEELFEPRRADIAQGIPARQAGIDRVRSELSARSVRMPAQLAILLPRQYVNPATERGLREAIVSYCDFRIRRVENELKALRRDGTQALLFGAILLAGFLALSEFILQTGLPSGIRHFFGDGLFLVAAWVGMWYPLDTLIYAGRPHRLERKLLRVLRASQLALHPADDEPANAAGLRLPEQG